MKAIERFKIGLKKNQIFYKQTHYLYVLKNNYQNDESKFIISMLDFGDMLIHHVTGFIYRYKRFRTKEEVLNYFLEIYRADPIIMNDIKFRKHLPYIKQIIELY